ncbi:BTB/POZ domain-containing protein At1g04390 [Ipomoea triloba]|uniref:BTB/POZ domain-containing protein At1g04390 n=1 Tax=Ipomoea triloba TaxID=35885 RepID=UPI00125DCAE5|nr:BTB/POZ domain-containing protein At1g04390 [Ipomoea triloba]
MRPSSSKHGAESNRGVSGHMFTLHQRLHHALGLGLGYYDDKGPNWNFTDFDRQKLVIRSIDAFLDCLSLETIRHPLVKDSIPGMIGALGSILGSKSQDTLILASELAVKIVSVLPSSMLESHFPVLVFPLSSLLSSHQSQISISSATALNFILSNLSTKREKEVWEILKQRNVVGDIVLNVKGFSIGNKPIEFFQEMASLLSKILQRWPSSRFCVYTDIKLLDLLDTLSFHPEISIKASVLQIHSAIALCLNGAKKILENGETLLKMMVDSMDISKPYSIQMEAFKLAQCLMMSDEECSTVIKICGESIVKAIITRMGNLSSGQKLAKDQMSTLLEACRLALITRWVGEHHHYFWKAGIDGVLLNLLLDNFHTDYHSLHFLPLREQIVKIKQGLQTSFCLPLRPYVWDILGYLAAHSAEDCNPMMHGHEASFNTLVVCACLAFVDSISVSHQIDQVIYALESVSRAVLMMIYSPWKYLAYQTRFIISEVLSSSSKDYVEYLLNTLRTASSGNKVGMPSNLKIAISLMNLACYSGLPKYRKHVIEHQGVTILLTFIRWWILNPICIRRIYLAPHLGNQFCLRACCWCHSADWEGEEILLLLGLWCLAELVGNSSSSEDHVVLSNYLVGADKVQFIEELQQICYNISSPGSRWYVAYILWHLGFYGFPTKFGQRVQKALNENQNSDLELILASQESIYVHGIILSVRCPSLLPSKELKEKVSFGSFSKQDAETHERLINKVQLSAQVDHQTLAKLLEYVYSGYFEAGEDLVKRLKLYAKHCNLRPLLHMLDRRTPKWGNPLPRFDLTCALESAGYQFSDIILEAKAADLPSWRCSVCCSLVPHYHLHKVVLWSSCDYFRALFQSGMQESHLQTLKVPVNWECLVKLVKWFYSGELPRPISGCIWDNLDIQEKQKEVGPYVELLWFTEFWLLDELHEDCFSVIETCLDSCGDLSIKLIQLAADHSQWKLVELCTKYAAPLYHRIRNCGEVDAMDENLVEMIRAASVRLSQEKHY